MMPNDDSSSWNMQVYPMCYIVLDHICVVLNKYILRVSVCSLGWFDLVGDVGSREELGTFKWTFTVQGLVHTSDCFPLPFYTTEMKVQLAFDVLPETTKVYIARSPCNQLDSIICGLAGVHILLVIGFQVQLQLLEKYGFCTILDL